MDDKNGEYTSIQTLNIKKLTSTEHYKFHKKISDKQQFGFR